MVCVHVCVLYTYPVGFVFCSVQFLQPPGKKPGYLQCHASALHVVVALTELMDNPHVVSVYFLYSVALFQQLYNTELYVGPVNSISVQTCRHKSYNL